ncbi:MAG TPA: hypothetical protein PKM48_07540 [Parvularculaceae bacterium]|nr:hypothetical protein [Parvularculaceae bacterium]HNS86855.1 hypothetical protein [Parvularculaceae bacterium]
MFLDRIIAGLKRAAGLTPAHFDSGAAAPAREADGAVVTTARAAMAAAPEIVRRLVDPSAEGHRWGLRGDKVEAVDRVRGLYRLTDRRMPDEPFLIQIEAATGPGVVATTVFGDGGAPIGAVVKSSSRYEIAPAPGGSDVTLTERTWFVDGLPDRQLKHHAHMMASGVRIDLFRLKEEAENAAAGRAVKRA